MRPPAEAASAARATAATYVARVRFLAFGFFLLFIAYSSAQLLQTALNGSRGYACLFGVYAAFGLFSLYAPALVALLGPNALLPASAGGYVLMVAANLFRSASAEFLLVPSCVLVGVCAATLWSSQAVYLGRAALELSRLDGRELTLCTSELNGKFYANFMFSGVFSGLFSSAVMMSGVPDAVALLFLLLTGVGAAGLAALALLPEPGDPSARVLAPPGAKLAGAELLLAAEADEATAQRASASWWLDLEAAPPATAPDSGPAPGPELPQVASALAPAPAPAPAAAEAEATPPQRAAPADTAALTSTAGAAPAAMRPTLFYMIAFLATDRRMRFIVPTIFVTGLGAGYVNGAWMGAVVSRRIGVELVGLCGATYSLASSLASSQVWAPLAQRPAFGRRGCFAVALVAYLAWYAFFAIYIAVTPPLESGVRSADAAVIFAGAVWHGLFDPVLSSFVPATLQTFFSSGRDALCAMSSVRVVYSLGFALAQLLSTSLAAAGSPRLAEQSALCGAFTLLAAACLAYLHFRICSIDATVEELAAAAAATVPVAAAPVEGGSMKIKG